jgi:UDP-N-acetylglucosamine--N-acetylmuramyl-(pentapeptide) pyrophosphoryl-undecaprenol N-acetylglucosamine transferase
MYEKLTKEHPGITIKVVGGATQIDKKMYERLGNDVIYLETGKLHQVFTLNTFLQFVYFIYGLVKSLWIILKIKPRLIFSKAGYVSLPIIFWAKFLHIPYFIHESDIEMGRANRFAAKNAEKIFLGFPKKYYPEQLQKKSVFVGQILRSKIKNFKKEDLYEFFVGIDKPTVFITGGSQGAKNINKAIFETLENLLDKYNLIHHTGRLDFSRAIDIRSKLNPERRKSYFVAELLDEKHGKDMMIGAIVEANLVISRGSATTMAEVASLLRPMIIIPYKYAASDHQTKNADFFNKADAAVVITDDELNGKFLLENITKLFKETDRTRDMANNAKKLFPTDGVDVVAKEILEKLSSNVESAIGGEREE